MDSFTHADQVRMDEALEKRNELHGVHHDEKTRARAESEVPGIHERKSQRQFCSTPTLILLFIDADSWWKSKQVRSDVTETTANVQ